jgi:hypothetical protein
MINDDLKPLDPELKAKAEARREEERARLAAMTREEWDAVWEEHKIRTHAEDIAWEERSKARTLSVPETSAPQNVEAPSPRNPVTFELRATVLDVLRENPDILRAAVRDALREMAEQRKTG